MNRRADEAVAENKPLFNPPKRGRVEPRHIILIETLRREAHFIDKRRRRIVPGGSEASVHTIETGLVGVVVIEPRVFEDARGFFFESYQEERFAQSGIRARFVQDNHSRSSQHTLRGLHYQLRHPQAKLCRVVAGEVIDVVVDVRPGSPTFGKWISVNLSAENKRMIYVPRGYAHGFAVLSDLAEFLYKCDDLYSPEDERGIVWNDPQLAIDWKIQTPALSAKDQKLPRLDEVDPLDLPAYS